MAVLCHRSELADPGSLGFDLEDEGQDQFFVVRVGESIHAWRNSCPHVTGSPMAWRRHAYLDSSRNWIQCHAHGALFDPMTGACVAGPCVGQALVRVDVQVDAEGAVRLAAK